MDSQPFPGMALRIRETWSRRDHRRRTWEHDRAGVFAVTVPLYILDARRTPIGALRGSLAALAPEDLAAAALRPLVPVAQAELSPGEQPFAVIGTAMARGNVARHAALAAGLDVSAPAWTVNAQCTSGLAAVRVAAERLAAGGGRLALAGGTESCSQADVATGAVASDPRVRVSHAPPSLGDPAMGPAADATAAHLGIPREDQDDWALESYERTWAVRRDGRLAGSIAPVDAGESPITKDDLPKRRPDPDRLRRYPPAFGALGTVTAGNAAPLADGAAAVLLAAGALHVLHPLARIRGRGTAGGDPRYPALAVVPAVERALEAAGLHARQVDRWEVNEAFAVKLVALVRQLRLDPARVNVNGGAVAFGHPFGASGAICLVHLVHELRRSGGRYGVAAIAGAGGLGEAMVIERLD